MNKDISKLINASLENSLPSLVLKNAKILDVFSLEIIEGDIAILDDIIIGIGEYNSAKNLIDLNGKFVSPGLVDPHVHIESSSITPDHFSIVLLAHGVTTAVIDPHEIANVLGKKGIQYMIDSTENIELDVFIMLPSCVPCTDFENSGSILKAEDLKEFYSHPRVLGLGELMNFHGLLNSNEDLISKINDVKAFNLTVDGHAPCISPKELNAYITAGISNDHECETASEMKIRLQRGMNVFIREGTVAKNLEALIGEINYKNNELVCFCTDDKDLHDLYYEGSIDHCIRKAVKSGMDPLLAVKLATYNAAKAHRLHDRGSVTPGKKADLLVLDNLENFTISSVYKNGKLISNKNKNKTVYLSENKIHVSKNMNWDIKLKSKKIRAVSIIPNNLYTNEKIIGIELDDKNNFIPDNNKDIIKLFVLERHNPDNNNQGFGILHGLNIKKGVIATTIAHDSHNLIMAGYNNEDFQLALKTIKEIKGGIVITADNKVLASVSLEVAGLMTSRSIPEVLEDFKKLDHALAELEFSGNFNPFLSLSFLSLPVIPKLKITDLGLFDVEKFNFVDLEI